MQQPCQKQMSSCRKLVDKILKWKRKCFKTCETAHTGRIAQMLWTEDEVECQLCVRHCSEHLGYRVERKPATLSNILVEETHVLANYLKMRLTLPGCFTYTGSVASSLPHSPPSPIALPFTYFTQLVICLSPTGFSVCDPWSPMSLGCLWHLLYLKPPNGPRTTWKTLFLA